MLLDLIFDKKIERGKLTVCANILLSVTLLSRAVVTGISLYALIMILSDDVIYTVNYSLVNEIKVFGTMPMGQLLKGVVYSSVFILMPLQVSSGLLGFLGVMCKHKVSIIIHVVLLFLTLSLLIVYFVLVGGVLDEFYSSIEATFASEIQYGSGRQEIQAKLHCCGVSGDSNYNWNTIGCDSGVYGAGCWDKWSNRMHTFCSTLMSFYALTFFLEVTNIVITDYKYREMRLTEWTDSQGTGQSSTRLPYDIFGDACRTIHSFLKRRGILEFTCRILLLLVAGLGMSMLAYGAASFEEYPKLSNPGIVYLTVNWTGLNLYSLVRHVSGLTFVLGSLTLVGAVVNTVSSCFESVTVLFSQAIILCAGIVMKVVFLFSWVALYVVVCIYRETRSSIADSLRELFTGRKYNDAWYDIVRSYDCCGIGNTSDTIDTDPADQQLCAYSYQYADKTTCDSAVKVNLDTFAKTTLCLLSIASVTEIVLLVYVNFKVRILSSEIKEDNSDRKGIPTYLKDFLRKLLHQSKLNWIPVLLLILVITSTVGFTSLGLSLYYDRIFSYIHISYLFSVITFGGGSFSDILTELSGTYFSLGAFEAVIYIALVITYTYKSRFLAVVGAVLQGFAAVTTVAFLSRWLFVANKVSLEMGDQLLTNLKEYYIWPDISTYISNAMTTPLVYSWNSLMLKIECCGAVSKTDFNGTDWITRIKTADARYSNTQVPSYCCATDPSARYSFAYESSCQESLTDDPNVMYQESCNTKVLARFTRYYVALFVVGILNVAMHVVLVVALVMRYRRLESKGKIDKTMDGLWISIKDNRWRLAFQMASVIKGILGMSLMIYGAVNIRHYPTLVISEVMAQIYILNMSFDDLVLCLCIGTVILGVGVMFTASYSFLTTLKSTKNTLFVHTANATFFIFLYITLVIVWIIVSTEMKSTLTSTLETFYQGKLYLTWWNTMVSVLRCCGLRYPEDTSDCTGNTTCTDAIQSPYNKFTGAVMAMVSLLLISEVAGLILGNVQVRKLSSLIAGDATEETDTAKGMSSYIKDKYGKIREEGVMNLMSFCVYGLLFVFGFAYIIFGLSAMHDGNFTDKNTMMLFDRLSFRARSFTTTMKYYGIGFICVGLIQLILSTIGALSVLYRSKVLVIFVIVLLGCFVISLFTMLAVWIDIHVEVAWNVYSQMLSDLENYYKSYGDGTGVAINYWKDQITDDGTLSWNSLFTKFYCCGVGGYEDFTNTVWYNARPDTSYKIPVYCCDTTNRYKFGYDSGCQVSLNSYYTTGCSSAVMKKFNMYSTALYVTMAIFIAIQVFQIVMLAIRLVRMLRRGIGNGCDITCRQYCCCFSSKIDYTLDIKEWLGHIAEKENTDTTIAELEKQNSFEESQIPENEDDDEKNNEKEKSRRKQRKRRKKNKIDPLKKIRSSGKTIPTVTANQEMESALRSDEEHQQKSKKQDDGGIVLETRKEDVTNGNQNRTEQLDGDTKKERKAIGRRESQFVVENQSSETQGKAGGIPAQSSETQGKAGGIPAQSSETQGKAGGIPAQSSETQGKAGGIPAQSSETQGKAGGIPAQSSETQGKAGGISDTGSYDRDSEQKAHTIGGNFTQKEMD